jgi:hypothetical protein
MKDKRITFLILTVGGAILFLQGLLAWGLSDFNTWEFLTFCFHVLVDAVAVAVLGFVALLAISYLLNKAGWYDQFHD